MNGCELVQCFGILRADDNGNPQWARPPLRPADIMSFAGDNLCADRLWRIRLHRDLTKWAPGAIPTLDIVRWQEAVEAGRPVRIGTFAHQRRNFDRTYTTVQEYRELAPGEVVAVSWREAAFLFQLYPFAVESAE